MFSFVKTAAFAALTLLASANASKYATGVDCKPCADSTGDCTVVVKINFFSSETGYFEIDGCEGVNPTLHLTVGRTYLFDQSDDSNWYHLVGFAYEADGAHVAVDELEPGIAPGDSDCADTLSCPAPMYWMDGKYTGVYSNNPDLGVPIPEEPSDDFGLDAVEPLFFHPLGDWQGYGSFVTALNFDTVFNNDIFYFCHVHAGMTGRIKLLDADGNKLSAEDTPAIPYEYATIDEFDFECGTFNLTDFENFNEVNSCPDIFVCEENVAPATNYAECVQAMNCHMMASMTTNAVGQSALFCHQMIPHHQNAVNMAKALLHSHDYACDLSGPTEEGAEIPWECELSPILYDIINVQNSQIIDMRSALEQLGENEYENCDVDFTVANDAAMSRRLVEPDFMQKATQRKTEECAYPSGIDCRPCEGAAGDCNVVVRVNLLAGETGYYEIEGCEGVNPTLHLEVGRTYLFDQSDKSNWYHLIGFSYEADGAHVGVDELEPGIAPGGSDCAETLSCPAPMYWMNDKYAGVYSNIESLIPVTTGEDDFGLDNVEPLFFHPLGDWQGYGAFVTALNFDTVFNEDIFYFCHVHAGMTGRIKLLDADGNKLSAEDTPPIPYEYATIDEFDFECGTFNLTDFENFNEVNSCPDIFVCEENVAPATNYAECVQAMNCHMMASMTTNAVGQSALFCHQMIPHHQNAVNMAKALLHSHDYECDLSGPTEEGAEIPWECTLSPILYDIINVQNSQIIDMRSALEQLGENEYENCDVDFTVANDAAMSRRLVEPDFMQKATQRKTEECAYPSGIDCRPCEGAAGDCNVVVRVNLLAGETGYYEIEGCEGVNPTLHLEVGRTYLFDQSDKSNWYHLIGFSYEADGAHAGVDELEPGIAPGGSDCAETLSCPAPMYWMNGAYAGVYSNIESLVPVTTGEDDFGLDNVEPLFFHPLGDWEAYGSFITALKFDDVNFNEDIFYFCHVHSLMTGRIKLIGSDGSKVSEANTPKIPYEYDCVSSFDESCGTFGIEQFQPSMSPQCPENFVCYDGAGSIGDMKGCIDAMNCAMLSGMTIFYGDEGKSNKINDTVLFLREMIPHHQNAVNMAKNLLNSGEVECNLDAPVEEGQDVSTACLLDPIVRSIINTQNSQIQAMYGLLDGFDVARPEAVMCDAKEPSDASAVNSLVGVGVALLAGLVV